MAPLATDKTDGVEVETIDDSHVNVVDKRAGNSNIKIFNFSRQACWVLEGVENWSINDKDLVEATTPTLSTAENFCYQRARTYGRLGGLDKYSLTGELFEAALENYLCAAASGDPQASLSAASLSLSGMASQLETEKVEALFKAAATTLASGASALSTFYCYGNDTDPEGPCQHPEEAERELIRAASMGSSDAQNKLGDTFETGRLVTKDASRALDCYRLAASKGNAIALSNLTRLKSQTADATETSHCY
jgi:TPR repeat protein